MLEAAKGKLKVISPEGPEDELTLAYPETVQIDYSAYSEREMFNKSLSTQRYKDGLLIVMRGHKSVKKTGGNLVMMTLRDNYENKGLTPAHKILKINQEALRVTCDINWKEDCFKNKLVFLGLAFLFT